MPCSCASAKPSGCASSSGSGGARRGLARAEELARRTPAGSPASQREAALRRRPRGQRHARRRACAECASARRRPRGTSGGRCAAAMPEPLRRRHRRLLGGGRGERALDRVADELVDRARIAKAHFGLLRMHVDVDAARIERQPQRVRRLAIVMQHVAIGFAQRMRQHAVAHEAAVDEHVLRRRPCAAYAGRTAKPVSRTPAASASTSAACSDERVAEQRLDARAPARRRAADAATRPLCCSVKPTSGCASAMRRNASSQCAHSVASVRRNLRRAGVLK